VSGLTLFGLFAVAAMLVCYALEERSPWLDACRSAKVVETYPRFAFGGRLSAEGPQRSPLITN